MTDRIRKSIWNRFSYKYVYKLFNLIIIRIIYIDFSALINKIKS